MEKRKRGNSELYINPVGLGCMGFSHASGDPTEKSVAVRTLREAYEIGYDFFDTAESYTGVNPDRTISYNEELVGEAVKGILSPIDDPLEEFQFRFLHILSVLTTRLFIRRTRCEKDLTEA